MHSMIKNSQHLRASIATYTGVEFFPLSPRFEDIYVEDLAHHLAHVCRYNGACGQHYSVAQHSVHVAEWLQLDGGMHQLAQLCDDPEDTVRWGLMHDASEAYIADICAPIKPFIQGYKLYEEQLLIAIAQRFGLPWPMPGIVHYADKGVFKSELDSGVMRQVGWWKIHPEHPDAGMKITPWSALEAKHRFLDKFKELFGDDVLASHRRP